ncbi:hypothetical protein GCM10009416_13690 [Craurococcus roseus]|uniref:Uncharacterized protein n=1 Tax=Craurococcus roseus TaxID=77585 RepID=A0ABP3Q1P6_9PROT
MDDPDVVTNYPSLLDPGSAFRNLDTWDSLGAVLLCTVRHIKNGNGTMNRDLQYDPLRIERCLWCGLCIGDLGASAMKLRTTTVADRRGARG